MWKDIRKMSREEIIEELEALKQVRDLSQKVSVDKLLTKELNLEPLRKVNLTMTANGSLYHRTVGFFPELVEEMFNRRKIYKKKMLEAQQEYEKNPSEKLRNYISEYNNIQQNLKICLNSLYGALGNCGFRYYRLDNAKAITFSGQTVIKWIETKLNIYLNKIIGTEDRDYVIALDTDSVVGDSVILVDDAKTTIEDFYNSVDGQYLKCDAFNSNFIKEVHNKTTISISKDGKLETKPIKYVMKHKVKKNLYKIKVNDKFVIVTEDHSIIVKDKVTGAIKSIKPKSLSQDKHFIINIVEVDTDTYAV
jgi:DNA polymerase elongation subunit (family B)